jgi:hypothetical protein
MTEQQSNVIPTYSVFSSYVKKTIDKCWWLTPEVLATPEAEIRRISIAQQKVRPYLKNTQHKTGLAEWLKW